jgi:hypothetical protein
MRTTQQFRITLPNDTAEAVKSEVAAFKDLLLWDGK